MKIIQIKAVWLGLFIGVISLYYAFIGVDWHLLGHSLGAIHLWPFVLCMFCISVGVFLRGIRWSFLLGFSLKEINVFARAVNLGILSNQILPGRFGEVVRIIVLRKELGISFSEVIASAFLDRIMDVIILIFSAGLVSTLVVQKILPNLWFHWLGVGLSLTVSAVVIVRSRRLNEVITYLSRRFMYRWSLRPDLFVKVFNQILSRASQWKISSSVIAIALLVWISDYLVVLAALWSLSLDLPSTAPLLLWVLLAAGSALPSAPGYVGVYQLAAIMALGTYDIPAHQAIAVSFVLQGATLVVSLIGAGGEVRRIWSTISSFPKREVN